MAGSWWGGLWLCEISPEQEVVVGRSTKGARRFCLVAACKTPPSRLICEPGGVRCRGQAVLLLMSAGVGVCSRLGTHLAFHRAFEPDLFTGRDRWGADLGCAARAPVPCVGQHRPPAAHQPLLPAAVHSRASPPVLQLPQTGLLQPDQGGHHYYSRSRSWSYCGVLVKSPVRSTSLQRREFGVSSHYRYDGGARAGQVLHRALCYPADTSADEERGPRHAVLLLQVPHQRPGSPEEAGGRSAL